MEVFTNKDVDEFVASLEAQTVSKILRNIDLLGEFGPELRMPIAKKVVPGIFELRIKGKQEIRIFYCFSKGAAYLSYGFVKKSAKIQRENCARRWVNIRP